MDTLLGVAFFAGLIWSGIIAYKYTRKAMWYERACLLVTTIMLTLFIIGATAGE